MNKLENLLAEELPKELVSRASELQQSNRKNKDKELARLNTELLKGFWNIIASREYRTIKNEASVKSYFGGRSMDGDYIKFTPLYCGVNVINSVDPETREKICWIYPGSGVTYFFDEYKEESLPDYTRFVKKMGELKVNIPLTMQNFLKQVDFLMGIVKANERNPAQQTQREKLLSQQNREDYLRRTDMGQTVAHFPVRL